jgi:hypothetical protein
MLIWECSYRSANRGFIVFWFQFWINVVKFKSIQCLWELFCFSFPSCTHHQSSHFLTSDPQISCYFSIFSTTVVLELVTKISHTHLQYFTKWWYERDNQLPHCVTCLQHKQVHSVIKQSTRPGRVAPMVCTVQKVEKNWSAALFK